MLIKVKIIKIKNLDFNDKNKNKMNLKKVFMGTLKTNCKIVIKPI